jgi:hypothetical protein
VQPETLERISRCSALNKDKGFRVKAKIEIELLVKFFGLVEQEATKEQLLAGVMVDFHHPKCLLGPIERDSIDVSFREITSISQIPESELDYYGLELEEEMQAIRFDQPVIFEIELELSDVVEEEKLLRSIDLDWEIFNEEFDLETESTSPVSSTISIT